jgi:hypothetical protein
MGVPHLIWLPEGNISSCSRYTPGNPFLGAKSYQVSTPNWVRRSDDLVVGQLALAAGSFPGFDSYVAAGVISGLSRDFPAEKAGWL